MRSDFFSIIKVTNRPTVVDVALCFHNNESSTNLSPGTGVGGKE